MTIAEAERIYEWQVEKEIEWCKKRLRKRIKVFAVIAAVLFLVGMVLLIIGLTAPMEIDYFGNETRTIGADMEIGFGAVLLGLGVLYVLPILFNYKALKNVPESLDLDLTLQIKNLYFNYLKCEDISQEEKEFYIQKLEDIRNNELVRAVHGASANASAAILFTTLRR